MAKPYPNTLRDYTHVRHLRQVILSKAIDFGVRRRTDPSLTGLVETSEGWARILARIEWTRHGRRTCWTRPDPIGDDLYVAIDAANMFTHPRTQATALTTAYTAHENSCWSVIVARPLNDYPVNQLHGLTEFEGTHE
ncbi:hypothetical protein [Flaviflexus massiliensis]|uniref:hypothetical protein n=1 Tax=Flaviflexus massiliensis TaxID=1522309 RepID=UPI0006D57625|nr:hypothetical protein [Flaviflexus massiliensis]